jgi:hypothetical protein
MKRALLAFVLWAGLCGVADATPNFYGNVIGGTLTVPYAASNCDGVLLQATCIPFGVDMTGTNDSTTAMQSVITYDCGLAHPVPIVLGPGVLKTGPVSIPCGGVEIDGTGNGGLLGGLGLPATPSAPGTVWLWNSAISGATGPLVVIGTTSSPYGLYADKLKNISFQSANGVGAVGVRLLGQNFGDFEDLSFDNWSSMALELKPYATSPTTGSSNYGNYFARLSWYNMTNSGAFVAMELVSTPVIENADFNEFHDIVANTSASGGLSLSCVFCDNNNFYNWHTVGAGATAGNISLTNGAASNNFYGYSCAGVYVDGTSNYNSFNEDDSANGCAPPTFASGGANNTAKVYGTSYNFHTGDTTYLALGNNFVAPPANVAGAYIGGNLGGNVAPQPLQIGTSGAATPITVFATNRTGGSGESDFINLFSTTQSGDAFHFIYEKSTTVDYTVANITRLGGVCPGNGTTGYTGPSPCIFGGTGAPTFSAPNASQYDRYDGSTGARIYFNTSGASTSGTTWLPISGI